jgi:mannose/cellobiose epimerase-like protein (N-acyl-D-glucosamine 2-epimerase family)
MDDEIRPASDEERGVTGRAMRADERTMTTQSRDAQALDIVATLRTLMIEHSLPLWAGEGWDRATGGFVEKLDREGRADRAAPRRVRVQARQIYCFAKAAQMGWYPEGREIAIKGLDYLLTKAKGPDGRPGFVHLLAPDGTVIDSARDTYDHAFVLLALASAYRLNNDAQIRSEIESLLTFLDTELRSPHGGYIEGIPASLPRRQNPQMHLFEAMIATVCVEPGHQAEWVWLLKGFERITNCPTARHRAGLLASALRYRDEATGCLLDEGRADGRIAKSTRRLWPQTEIAKAWLAQFEAGEQAAADEARDALVRLYRHYLCHPVRGAWYDQFDRDNQSLVDFIPASSFYHIVCAVSEAERVLG